MEHTIFDTQIAGLEQIHQGKVRDIYAIDDDHMLIITTDRLSAFDVILPTPIPGKGAVLTSVSNFWFHKTKDIIKNHLSDIPLNEVLNNQDTFNRYQHHAIVVERLTPLPIEAIVRGYIIGSGWKDYNKNGEICGISLEAGLKLADKFEQPLYTPSTKASVGDHDENVNYEHTVKILGKDMAAQVKNISLQLYTEAAQYALKKGIIIADTKFEFGTNSAGDLVLIDEALTPDSSRFWPQDQYTPGQNPPSFDKQYVRDYLETLDWDKTSPGPELPEEVVKNTAAKYKEAENILLGNG